MKTFELPLKVEKELDELKQAIRQVLGVHLKKILLFGSYARQEADEHSDLDLVVLTDLDEKALKQEQEKIRSKCADLFIQYNVLPNVMLRNEQLFLERSQYVPFYKTVMEEGVVIYG